jgi:hypothetical protein
VQALYLDDEMSGWEVYSNSFYNCQAGTFIGGGRDNHFHDNYYENCGECANKCSQCRQRSRPIHCLTCSDLLSPLSPLGSQPQDLAQHFDNRGMNWQNYGCNCTTGPTTCNPAAASAIVKDPAYAAYVASFPEIKTAMLPSDGEWALIAVSADSADSV